MRREQAHQRLQSVFDELLAARFSTSFLLTQIERGGDPLSGQALRPVQFKRCAANLEYTYTLRLFAAFESVLRSYYAVMRPSPRVRRTKISILMDRLASRCTIPFDILKNAHDVREYRNSLIHPAGNDDVMTFGDCKQRLSLLVSHLPRNW